MGKNIAIDGPAGAGKSTLSKRLAAALQFVYVDTGALYRCVGLYAKENGIDPKDATAVSAALQNIAVEMQYIEGEQHVFLNGKDVSTDIREHDVSDFASKVSAIPAVRSFLLDMQRSLAERYDVIMDGRDIGTVVLPHADVKIFLTASVEERAARRYRELVERGQSVDLAELTADIAARDLQDSTRAIAPLKPAEDSVLVDTTGLDFEGSLQKLLDVIKEKL